MGSEIEFVELLDLQDLWRPKIPCSVDEKEARTLFDVRVPRARHRAVQ
jgi:hypothetical protein